MTQTKYSKTLEIIVSTLYDAIEAQEGGADRLEVVRALETGGLTPELDLVSEIAAAVRIPIRVMLRENGGMLLKDSAELDVMQRKAQAFGQVGVDGLVAGFVCGGEVDLRTMRAIADAVPQLKITFHRAFDELPDPVQAISVLKTIPQVDRILTIGGNGSWPVRKKRLHEWQQIAQPEITILAGAGLRERVITDLSQDVKISEIHIGRAARIPQETGGKVCRVQVAQLKGLSA